MLGGFLGRLGDYGNVQAATDDLGDLFQRDTFLCDRMEGTVFGAVLEGEAIDTSRIEPMHGGPTVMSLAYVRGDALLARDTD